MKNKLFAAALAAVTIMTAGVASAQDYRRGGDHGDYRGDYRHRAEITVQKDGRTMTFGRRDRMFYRLLDRPFHFRPGLTYRYTDRCNRNGCVAFVFDGRYRRPIDRIFAPHLRDARYAWRDGRGFDRDYSRFGDYDRSDRSDRWSGEYDRWNRDWRNGDDDDGWDRDDDDRGGRDGRGDRDFERDGRRDGSGLRGGPSGS